MEFGSKYAYCYNGSDEECVSDEEYSTGITDDSNPLEVEQQQQQTEKKDDQPSSLLFQSIFGSTGFPKRPGSTGATGSTRFQGLPEPFGFTGPFGPPGSQEHSKEKTSKKSPSWTKPVSEPSEGAGSAAGAAKGNEKKWRKADTNVVAIKFDELTKPSNMHTGDAVTCRRCRAILSHLSTITDCTADEKVWQCEFCYERNVVEITAEEIPSEPDVTYMISPAPATTAASCKGDESSMVIFCIDVSGSMGGRVANGTMNRLQCVTAAVMDQLKQLRDEHPTRKVALVTFDSQVSLFGDGTSAARHVSGSALNNYDELTKIGIEAAVPAEVSSSFDFLHDKIATLRPGSETALGPALLMSVFMASKLVGSRVVLCTDGCANEGLGQLGTSRNASSGPEFYARLGETASSKSVVVSVLSVADSDCRLIEIGSVAQATGGHVSIVDPRKLTDELGEIFVTSLIAINVSATFIVHRGLYIRGEMQMTSSVTRKIGNVTKDMDITFEYGIRPDASWGEHHDMPSELPFQLQVTYTDLDGATAMRVLTKVQPVTKDRNEAETHINVPVVTCHASKRSSEMAMKGDYTPSRLNALMHQRLVARNTCGDRDTYRVYSDQMRPIEQRVLSKQRAEAASYHKTVSSYEDDIEDADFDVSPTGLGSKLAVMYKRKGGACSEGFRRSKQTDQDASDMYSCARTTVDKLKK